MIIIRTDQADLGRMDNLEKLAFYNGLDNLLLPEIHAKILDLLSPTQLLTYKFEMELLAPLFEMSKNGLHVDTAARTRMIEWAEQERIKYSSYLDELCVAIGYYDYYKEIAVARYASATGESPSFLPRSWNEWLTIPLKDRRELKAIDENATKEFHKALKEFDKPFNGTSSTQKLRLFFHFFGSPKNTITQEMFPDFPPPWSKTRGILEIRTRSTSGEYTPGADRDVLERLQKRALESTKDDAVFWAQPFISCCLALADCTKTLGFLKCKLEEGMFKYSFGAVTETGRLNSKANAQGFGSNAQNVTPKLRHIFTCPIGQKLIAIDFSQIESRNVAAICFTLFGAERYLAAVNSGDAHSLTCALVWPDRKWPEEFTIDHCIKYGTFPEDILKAAKKVAGEEFYRGKSLRDASKTLGHGSNYLGKPPTMSKHSHIPVELVKHFQDAYFEAFPEIKQWHYYVLEQIQLHQKITTLFGRERQFFGRPTDDSTLREAVAFEPQSLAADYTNKALLELHKQQLAHDLPYTLVLQKHDEIVARFPEKEEEFIVKHFTKTMEQHIMLTAPNGVQRDWFVPADAETGWNLGRKSDKNPDGLSHPDPSRVRLQNPFNLLQQKL